MKYLLCLATLFTLCLPVSPASAENKVVVIPLNSSKYAPGGVSTVISAEGKVWMDRNLGALRVATKSADPDSYGTLYQWGRGGDGHEYRSSPTVSMQSSSDQPNHGSFITEFNDWRSTPSNNLWQGESGPNNPCPAGFRLPTASEWQIEIASWSSRDSAGAFASPLRLSAAGYRSNTDGSLKLVGGLGSYWSSTVDGNRSYYYDFGSGYSTEYLSNRRASGRSIRCLQD
ncbi:MAG: hypothetical protein V2I36_16900 [Desulfopila sp.]|jgi:uncharacterized protein (TIGR02145 family)|nr:hypothetical protein [Desulfopila sp.]